MNRRRQRDELVPGCRKAFSMIGHVGNTTAGGPPARSAGCTEGTASWPRHRGPAELAGAHQIVGEREPKQDGTSFGQAATARLSSGSG
jgi:hypothetical protein